MHFTNIRLGPQYQPMLRMLETLAQQGPHPYNVQARMKTYPPAWFDYVGNGSLSDFDTKVKAGKSLTFHEAFAGMCMVLAATNNYIRTELFPKVTYEQAIAMGTAFLQLLSMKEVTSGLTPEEIAGIVAASYLDVVYRFDAEYVVETCGMGGDLGWDSTRSVKTINISTLSALVLASLGYATMKHGSFGNTTKVGSTDVPLGFGANISTASHREIMQLMGRCGFWFSDAHAIKTLHYLSHLLRHETVNHVIGPMTPPVSATTPLYKVMGVNHHVAPQIAGQAFALLHKKGVCTIGGVAVIAGLSSRGVRRLTPQSIQRATMLDEVSPYGTVVTLAQGPHVVGTFLLEDKHFDGKPLNPAALKVKNAQQTLMGANERTLRGLDPENARFLARETAIAIMLLEEERLSKKSLDRLPDYTNRALCQILSGGAFNTLTRYVAATGGSFRSWI